VHHIETVAASTFRRFEEGRDRGGGGHRAEASTPGGGCSRDSLMVRSPERSKFGSESLRASAVARGVAIRVRLGDAADVDAAVSVYERSNLARRQGDWPNRAARVEHVRTLLRDTASWFFLANEGPVSVGMACAEPLRGEDGTGPDIPGGCFLNLLFVVPERWGEGIGGILLDAVLAEAKRRNYSRVHLWTHEDNERSHRLYLSRGFSRTGRTSDDETEWARNLAEPR
jgi:GNAT superfamily N-acetyltransferase